MFHLTPSKCVEADVLRDYNMYFGWDHLHMWQHNHPAWQWEWTRYVAHMQLMHSADDRRLNSTNNPMYRRWNLSNRIDYNEMRSVHLPQASAYWVGHSGSDLRQDKSLEEENWKWLGVKALWQMSQEGWRMFVRTGGSKLKRHSNLVGRATGTSMVIWRTH